MYPMSKGCRPRGGQRSSDDASDPLFLSASYAHYTHNEKSIQFVVPSFYHYNREWNSVLLLKLCLYLKKETIEFPRKIFRLSSKVNT